MTQRHIPEITGNLRRHMIKIPEVISKASGIRINGKLFRSLVFSTDVAIIKNINTDGVIAVYPFTPQPIITKSIMEAADIPVFCGIGGGITFGKRTVNLALHAEFEGAAGVVVNAPVSNELIHDVCSTIDIPVIVTVVSQNSDFEGRMKAGASVFNVSGGSKTIDIVRHIRSLYPDFPLIATGGPNDESILKTIEAGANCITYTPPTTGELLKHIMDDYRERL